MIIRSIDQLVAISLITNNDTDTTNYIVVLDSPNGDPVFDLYQSTFNDISNKDEIIQICSLTLREDDPLIGFSNESIYHYYVVYRFTDSIQAIKFKLLFSDKNVSIPIPSTFINISSQQHEWYHLQLAV